MGTREGEDPAQLLRAAGGDTGARVPVDRLPRLRCVDRGHHQHQPGECSGHRDIANLVVHTHPNLLRVLQYAVEVLKLKHGIVRGDYTAAA
jgi:hypothetical protein